jgi:hypothetical protein
MVGFLCSGFAKIAGRFVSNPPLGSFGLAVWAVLLFYNVTESALRLNLLWVVFLLTAVTLSDPTPHAPRALTITRKFSHSNPRRF